MRIERSLAVLSLVVTLGAAAVAGCACRPGRGPSPLATRLLDDCKVMPNIAYCASEGWEGKLDLYYPRHVTAPPPIVIYFHGGGWIHRSKADAVLAVLPYLEMGLAVANVDYRIGPVDPAPAAVVDCRCALRWVIRHAEEYFLDPARVVVTGHSAGGHLALVTGMLPDRSALDTGCGGSEGRGAPASDEVRVAAIINWFGITDVADLLAGDNATDFAKEWVGDRPDRLEIARLVSPLTYVRPDLPPILSVHGDSDPVVPYRHAVRLHEALSDAGVPNRLLPVRGGGHGGFSPEQNRRAYGEIRRFLRQHEIWVE